MSVPITDDFNENAEKNCCCFSRLKKHNAGITGLKYVVRNSTLEDLRENGSKGQGIVNASFQLERQGSTVDSYDALGDAESFHRVVLFRMPGWAALAIAAYKERANREFTMNGVSLPSDSQSGYTAIRELDETGEPEGGVVPIGEYVEAQASAPSTSAALKPINHAEVVYAKRSTF